MIASLRPTESAQPHTRLPGSQSSAPSAVSLFTAEAAEGAVLAPHGFVAFAAT